MATACYLKQPHSFVVLELALEVQQQPPAVDYVVKTEIKEIWNFQCINSCNSAVQCNGSCDNATSYR